MNFLNKFLIKLFCNKIGCDEFGNEYFENNQGKRFVTYNGIAEPSKIPAEWHVWIHYSSDIAPVNLNTKKHSWQKIHLPNLTGTKNFYSPKTQTSANYEAWKPSSK